MINRSSSWSKILPYLILLLLAIIGYWQISFMIDPLTYDMTIQAFQWRYFVGECLRDQLLPLWNPYQHMGYPIHADPQGTAWYPITWVIGFIAGYNMSALSFDFILHVFLAGTGMYHLAKKLEIKDPVALLVGITYMFCGFFISNAQHFSWIGSATWVPFILCHYIAFSKGMGLKHAILTGFFMFLLLTGGYPVFAIILFYFFIILLVWFLIKWYKESRWEGLFRLLKLNSIAAGTAILLSMVVWVSLYLIIPYMSRAEGLSLETAHFNPFSPRCMISFILPFGVVKEHFWFDTDYAMANGYFGIIFFLFFIYSLFLKKPAILKILLWWGIFTLLASMGKYTPVRELLFRFIPFMDLFRFPSMFRLFSLISFILLAGWGMQHFLNYRKKILLLKSLSIIMLIVLIFTPVFIRIFTGEIGLVGLINDHLFNASKDSTLIQHLVFQSIIQSILILLLIILILKPHKKRIYLYLLIGLVVFDMIFAAQLNGPYTVYGKRFSTKEIDTHIKTFPNGFPIPSTGNIIENNDNSTELKYGPLWLNMNICKKEIAHGGYNPFMFKSYDHLMVSLPDLLQSTINNPPVFLSGQIYSVDSIKTHITNKNLQPGNLYFSPADLMEINSFSFNSHEDDHAYITAFSPIKAEIDVKTGGYLILTFLQSNYYGWKASIDKEPVKIYTSNTNFISIIVPPGDHQVIFNYKPGAVILAFYISLLSLLGFCIYFIANKVKELSKKS